MASKLSDLISYINENIRFGSVINLKSLNNWYNSYSLSLGDKLLLFDELKSLKITLINEPKDFLSKLFFHLVICLGNNKEVKSSILDDWFSRNNVNEKKQLILIDELKNKNYRIIEDEEIRTFDGDLDFLFDYEDDLDSLLENDSFIEEIDSYESVIDKSNNLQYITDYQGNDLLRKETALENLVLANKRLVWKIVKRYSGLSSIGFDIEDMYQAGMIGMMKAIEKFDPSKGFQFSTYAVNWIRQSITRGIADYSTLIRIPVHRREQINKLISIENELWNELARPGTKEELSIRMGMTIDEVELLQYYALQSNLDSLNILIGESQDTPLMEMLIDKSIQGPGESYYKLELRKILDEMFKKDLTERETNVLYLRFGLQDGRIRTLQEIGENFDVSRERIRQIESKALRKMGREKNKNLLKEHLYEY